MMPIELNVQGDFATIFDGGEAITLKRRDHIETIAVTTAWRFSSRSDEVLPSGGRVARHDVVWQFPWDGANDLPRLGDSIIDSAGECWTIQAVEELSAETRLRCTARNLRMLHSLNDRVEVQRAVWEDQGSGPEIVAWTTLRAALPARIQPDKVVADNAASPPTSTATFRIILGEQIELDNDCRFVDTQGNVYQFVELTQAERIDDLPVAKVVGESPEIL